MKADSDCTLKLAIDGPAASGKSIVGREIACRLRLRFLDTGTMYRAITWEAIRTGVSPNDACKLTAIVAHANMRLAACGDGERLLLNGDDITDMLRLPEVDANVSAVSAVSGVRRALVAQQRNIAADSGIVMCGRDIGTVVLPDAGAKIFLTASTEVRAMRRAIEAGQEHDLQRVLEDMRRRDKTDSERDDSPLRPADDATIICTDNLTVEDVVLQILSKVRAC